MSHEKPNQKIAGRGSSLRIVSRFESVSRVDDEEVIDDPEYMESLGAKVNTEYFEDSSSSVVSENSSPDIPFRYSLNPYRGCSHGCSYCYARPTHEYLGFGPGLDFESRIVIKPNAAQLFRNWLVEGHRKGREVDPVMMSGVTDCYQTCEKQFELTRQCLEVARDFRYPVSLITKNALIRRDLDLIEELASMNLVSVAISVTSLDQSLTRIMEPRTSAPAARLDAIRQIAATGCPVMVMVAPIIPGINEQEIPGVLKAAAEAGATRAGYVSLRLPLTVEPVFLDWLLQHFPDRKEKVVERIRTMRDGKMNSSAFGERMTGNGVWADQTRQLMTTFCKRYGLDCGVSYGKPTERPTLRTDLFRVVESDGRVQRELF
ncbi:PA0069 family radical SAM protein [Mariniblastus fucicola]|uniref:Radical SAM superfamily protein n=1 Tax=Mariniblastus fucicola TaxID=980251 RepID=A0A5B9P6G9_9BACT|nr:PA0069 family radical SAM protein [Mariniblastus fucicola]QEG20775.1 Radical SAM superfamily protein [Mariniblastus fucicola]